MALFAGKRGRSLPARRRRLLVALAAFLAFGTAVPVALTGLFFFVFGAIEYCEDAGAPARSPGGRFSDPCSSLLS